MIRPPMLALMKKTTIHSAGVGTDSCVPCGDVYSSVVGGGGGGEGGGLRKPNKERICPGARLPQRSWPAPLRRYPPVTAQVHPLTRHGGGTRAARARSIRLVSAVASLARVNSGVAPESRAHPRCSPFRRAGRRLRRRLPQRERAINRHGPASQCFHASSFWDC